MSYGCILRMKYTNLHELYHHTVVFATSNLEISTLFPKILLKS